jgi:hypothetical protein
MYYSKNAIYTPRWVLTWQHLLVPSDCCQIWKMGSFLTKLYYFTIFLIL